MLKTRSIATLETPKNQFCWLLSLLSTETICIHLYLIKAFQNIGYGVHVYFIFFQTIWYYFSKWKLYFDIHCKDKTHINILCSKCCSERVKIEFVKLYCEKIEKCEIRRSVYDTSVKLFVCTSCERVVVGNTSETILLIIVISIFNVCKSLQTGNYQNPKM